MHCLSCLGNTVVNTLPTILCNLLTKDVQELLTSSAGPLKLGGGGDHPHCHPAPTALITMHFQRFTGCAWSITINNETRKKVKRWWITEITINWSRLDKFFHFFVAVKALCTFSMFVTYRVAIIFYESLLFSLGQSTTRSDSLFSSACCNVFVAILSHRWENSMSSMDLIFSVNSNILKWAFHLFSVVCSRGFLIVALPNIHLSRMGGSWAKSPVTISDKPPKDEDDPFGVHFQDGDDLGNLGPKSPPRYKRDAVTGKFTGEEEEELTESQKKLLKPCSVCIKLFGIF